MLFALEVETILRFPLGYPLRLELLVIRDVGAVLPNGRVLAAYMFVMGDAPSAFGDASRLPGQPTPGIGRDDIRLGLDEETRIRVCIIFLRLQLAFPFAI